MRIAPLPEDFLERARVRGLDDQGQPVRRLTAAGGEPCRDVLRRARPGEQLILASFCPFEQAGPYREFGPVFLLAGASDEPVARDERPLGQPGYLGADYVIRAYGRSGDIIEAERVSTPEGPARIAGLLERPEVAWVDARFPLMACFACRIVR
ncbi:MAG TPA: DUF1203 domain-containing protein [Herpetosiphonaceae bacterium]|nr:DUF1203 domain-containing protein [Herpetosiphonaceae bacterium]